MTRPSKTFLYNFLDKELANANGDVAIDAASAGFKNRKMFRTNKYFGLDYDLEQLEQGLNASNGNCYAIHADVRDLSQIPTGSVDVVVSTNTLYVLSPEDRKQAVSELLRITSPQGLCILEMPNDQGSQLALPLLKQNFEKVRINYYKNILSQFYEGIFEKNGYLGHHRIASSKPFRLIAWIISQIEQLAAKRPNKNKHLVAVVQQKRLPERNIFQPDLESRIIKYI